jgi:hypothetical protein
MQPTRPHFSLPFGRDPSTGKVSVVEQDTAEHVMSCETMIVVHPLGFRDERPDFGWAWPEFRSLPLDLGALQEALTRLEPRGKPGVAVEYADVADASVRHVSIDVQIGSESNG